MEQDHPSDYPKQDHYGIDAKLLRDQITSKARTVLLVLLATSGLIFIIACSNVANLILARTVRREGDLVFAPRSAPARVHFAALCSRENLSAVRSRRRRRSDCARRSLSARHASRFSVRARSEVDSTMLWVGAGPSCCGGSASVVRRLPSANASRQGEIRQRRHTRRRPDESGAFEVFAMIKLPRVRASAAQACGQNVLFLRIRADGSKRSCLDL